MRDGTQLAAKLWIPELVEKSADKATDAECEKYPAILGELNLCKYSGVVPSLRIDGCPLKGAYHNDSI